MDNIKPIEKFFKKLLPDETIEVTVEHHAVDVKIDSSSYGVFGEQWLHIRVADNDKHILSIKGENLTPRLTFDLVRRFPDAKFMRAYNKVYPVSMTSDEKKAYAVILILYLVLMVPVDLVLCIADLPVTFFCWIFNHLHEFLESLVDAWTSLGENVSARIRNYFSPQKKSDRD